MSKVPKSGSNIDYDAILSGLGFDPTEFDILDVQSSGKPLNSPNYRQLTSSRKVDW